MPLGTMCWYKTEDVGTLFKISNSVKDKNAQNEIQS